MGKWEKDNYKTIPLLMKRTMIELTKGRTSKLSNISGLAHYVAIKVYVMSIIFVKMSPPTIKAGVCEQCSAVSVISRKEQHATKIIIQLLSSLTKVYLETLPQKSLAKIYVS